MTEQPRSYWRSAEEARQSRELPEQAIEAAARALFEMAYDPMMWDWAGTIGHRQTCINQARLALTAAAPYVSIEQPESFAQSLSRKSMEAMEQQWRDEQPRKLTPTEIEEWRNTCPYPEALGK